MHQFFGFIELLQLLVVLFYKNCFCYTSNKIRTRNGLILDSYNLKLVGVYWSEYSGQFQKIFANSFFYVDY